jgi:hypothetical protein
MSTPFGQQAPVPPDEVSRNRIESVLTHRKQCEEDTMSLYLGKKDAGKKVRWLEVGRKRIAVSEIAMKEAQKNSNGK